MSRATISQTASRDLVEILDYFANINIEAGEREKSTIAIAICL
jgi:toxin ParE1/3/4